MLQTKSFIQEKSNENSYLLINFIFAFFPISFILGSFVVNLNLFLFCCLGIFYLKSKILKTKFDFSIKIIFLFFLIIFLSTCISFIKSLYVEGYDSINLSRLIKSIIFFRFFLFLIIIYLLDKFSFLCFKYFFITAAFSSVITSVDIIYQYIFGFDIIGLKNTYYYNSGFFGDELIAGGYLQRFSFFAVFIPILVFKNKNYVKFFSTIIIVCVLGVGILFSGNRMPLVLFIFGLFLIFLFNFRMKKILLASLISLFVFLSFIISSNQVYKDRYYASFYERIKNIVAPEIVTWAKRGAWPEREKSTEIAQAPKHQTRFYTGIVYEPFQRRLFLTALDTWKFNKIFGNGIKSFREDCWKLRGPDVNLEENLYPGKKNRLCSNHPHNYYFEVLTETGIIGLVIVSIIAFSFLVFLLKNLKPHRQINIENIILLTTIISIVLEMMPFKSTGSLFTTNNATYIIIIGSILLSCKEKLKN